MTCLIIATEVFTGKLTVAIADRVVEVDVEEDELEGAEAIEMDQCFDTMKTSVKSIISITETLRRKTEKRKENREKEKAKKFFKYYLTEYISQYNYNGGYNLYLDIQSERERERARGRLITASHML